ncbi:MAG: hypothetical protein IPO21_12950 [Bacteroidales bacterium]|nr:hypothetical protein [Bacteroidales bacterium]
MQKFRNKYRIESHRHLNWNYSTDGYYFITIVTSNRDYVFGTIKSGKMILSDYGIIAQNEWIKSFQMRSELFSDEFIIMPNHIHAIVIIDSNRCIENTNILTDLKINNCVENTNIRTDNPVETHGRASQDIHINIKNNIYMNSCNNEIVGDNETIINETNLLKNETHGLINEKHVLNNETHVLNNETNLLKNETHVRASLRDDTYEQGLNRRPKSISSFIAGYKSAVISKIDDLIDKNQDCKIPKFNKQNPLWQRNYHDHIIRTEQSYLHIKNYIINNPSQWEEDLFFNGE